MRSSPGAALWCCGGGAPLSPQHPPPERIMTQALPPASRCLDPAAPSFAPSSVPGDLLLPQDPTHLHPGVLSLTHSAGPLAWKGSSHLAGSRWGHQGKGVSLWRPRQGLLRGWTAPGTALSVLTKAEAPGRSSGVSHLSPETTRFLRGSKYRLLMVR